MKKIVSCIGKENVSLISNVVSYCESNGINEIIILLFGDSYGKKSIVEKDGLIQLVNAMSNKTNLSIHLVREGLGYTLSANDYHKIFDSTNYAIENTYTCKHMSYQLLFKSNNLEDSMWDDQYFGELQKQASSKTDIKISAVYKPIDNDYMSDWGKSAWKLSKCMDSTLLYLDDGDVVEFDGFNVYQLYMIDNSFKRGNQIKAFQ